MALFVIRATVSTHKLQHAKIQLPEIFLNAKELYIKVCTCCRSRLTLKEVLLEIPGNEKQQKISVSLIRVLKTRCLNETR